MKTKFKDSKTFGQNTVTPGTPGTALPDKDCSRVTSVPGGGTPGAELENS
ncbi:hypothetical protein [Cylindrospermum stagnale]|nr:hypothetical protein [Cylindrospermum stagnale]